MSRLAGTVALCALCAWPDPTATAQQKPRDGQQTGTFKSSTSLVEVDIIVKDKDGRFVGGLTSDDFEVLEAGKPQPIQHFYLVTENPTSSGEISAQVVLPRSPDQRERRVFVIMFDSEHLAPTNLGRLKKAASDFVRENFRPTDLGGVFMNGGLWHGRMSSDRQELLAGIRAVTPAFETTSSRIRPLLEFPRIEGEFDAIRIDAGDQRLLDDTAQRNCTDDPDACAREGGAEYVVDKVQQKARQFIEDSRRATSSTIDALGYIASNLARLEGRKTMLLLSEGFFVDDVRGRLPQVAGLASRAGITIYTLNVRGTDGAGGRMFADASLPGSGWSLRADTSEEGLDVLSAETGGISFRHTDNFSLALSSVASDTSTYYVLAYSPENTTLDGKFRRIELRTKWKGLTVRARRGYVASPLPPPKQIRTK